MILIWHWIRKLCVHRKVCKGYWVGAKKTSANNVLDLHIADNLFLIPSTTNHSLKAIVFQNWAMDTESGIIPENYVVEYTKQKKNPNQ